MAEGDTILRAARRIEAAIGGEVVRAEAPSPRGRAAGVERLDGLRLDSVEARGKHLLLRFGDLVLHSHLGMNGGWHVARRGTRWRRPRPTAWVILEGSGAAAAQFGGSTLRVVREADLRRDPRLARLGPDILGPEFRPEAAVRLLRRGDPRRSVGEALLDQSAVAGIGNIFKSEACFAARLDPRRPVGELTDPELEAALSAARRLMLAAVDGGRGGRGVYRRRGRPCPVCGTPIAAAAQGDGARSTYWCPRCQVEPLQGLPKITRG